MLLRKGRVMCDIFKETAIFKMKILKEVGFSERLLILREIRFVWNNGGQKHSLSFDVMCPVSGQFFFAVQNR